MHKSIFSKVAGLLVAALAAGVTALPARADDFGKRITLSIAPTYQTSANGDFNAPVPPGRVGVGYTNDHPAVDDTGLDYGLDYRFDRLSHIYYTHTTFHFALGRILTVAPTVSFVTGSLFDRTDTLGINHALTKDLNLRLFAFDHQRMGYTGVCGSKRYCSTPATGKFFNPATIDEHGYDAGFSYGTGPLTKIGRLLVFTGDAKYVPRPATGPRTATGAPAFALNGLGAYPGSKFLFPYSVQMKLPFANSRTFIPFVGYARSPVYYRGESSQQLNSVISYGFTKVFSKNLLLTIRDLGYFGCRCTSTVVPPDNVRFNVLDTKLDYHFTL